jgi:hypothetical protein
MEEYQSKQRNTIQRDTDGLATPAIGWMEMSDQDRSSLNICSGGGGGGGSSGSGAVCGGGARKRNNSGLVCYYSV